MSMNRSCDSLFGWEVSGVGKRVFVFSFSLRGYWGLLCTIELFWLVWYCWRRNRSFRIYYK